MDARRARSPRILAAVAAGAVVGAGTRWAVLAALGPGAVHLSLLLVNVAGCVALGLVAELPPGRTERAAVEADLRAMLGAGVCGSLTTWSSLAVESAGDLRRGAWAVALGWLAANLAGGLAAAVGGRRLGLARWPRGNRLPAGPRGA